MHVEIGFFCGDKLLHRGYLLLTADALTACFGEHKHFSLVDGGTQRTVVLFSGLVIDHSFSQPACALNLRYFVVESTGLADCPFRQRKEISSSLMMGVHYSEDWESIQLSDYTLAFKCTPLP